MKQYLRLSTDLVDPGLRNEYWRELVRPLYDPQPSNDDRELRLEGTISSRFIGSLSIDHFQFNSQRHRRGQRIIRQSGLDQSYLVQLRLAGTTEVDCEGRKISIGPGDVTVFDLNRGWASIASSCSALSMVLPRGRIDSAAKGCNLHGTSFKAGSPETDILADYITGLYRMPKDVENTDALAIEEGALALFAPLFGKRALSEVPDESLFSRVLRQRVLEFIDANLVMPDLGPALLMRRFRVSRAHLYRIFAVNGGVMTVIRDKRLDAAFQLLTHPVHTVRSITEIAHGLGFSGSSHFLRAFRTRFDMTPSEARQIASQRDASNQRLSSLHTHLIKYARGSTRNPPTHQ